MRIHKVLLHNYRSIRDLEMECGPSVVLLGPNNHGKSNIVSAIEFFLAGTRGVTLSLKEDDFFVAPKIPRSRELWVEVVFDELTEQEKNTFKKYVLSNQTLEIRKFAKVIEDGNIEIGYRGYVEEPEEWWLQSDSLEKLTNKDTAKNTPLAELLPDKGRLTKNIIEEIQTKYKETHLEELNLQKSLEKGPLLGLKSVATGILPEVYLVPAVRDLSDETKIKTSTTFGRLFNRAVKEMLEASPKFQEIREGMEELTDSIEFGGLEKRLEEELTDWGVSVGIEVTPPPMEKIFEWGTDLMLDDGIETSAIQKGHGLQRAVIFALLRAWAKALRASDTQTEEKLAARKASDSVVFAIEEPELFLHPHAQRRLAHAIRDIADTPDHQIFVCTHSTHFVNLDEYKSICIIRKDDLQEGTTVRQCKVELFAGQTLNDRKWRLRMAKWVNPDRGEMFFAKRVVFVEGETEKAIFPFLADKLDCFDSDVSIIDCGSKFNLKLYIKIANAFKLRYVVVHDEDPLPDPIPDDWEDEKIRAANATFHLNEELTRLANKNLGQIYVFSPCFEEVAGISKSQQERKGKPLATLEYFEDKINNGEEIPEEIGKVVRAIYQEQCDSSEHG